MAPESCDPEPTRPDRGPTAEFCTPHNTMTKPSDALESPETPENAEASDATGRSPAAKQKARPRPAGGDNLAVLEKLATLYPQLFGAVFLPLKRGIFQDLLDANPGLFTRDALKAALAQHTRNGRYLAAVAEGRQRHDLSGQAVEAMAPEHVHHALLEVFRRRQARSQEDLRPTLRRRMAQAFVRSGLALETYTALVHSRDEAANQLLADALLDVRANAARDEALLRAFESGAQGVAAFADMYGMEQRSAGQTLERARRARAAGAAAIAAATAKTTSAATVDVEVNVEPKVDTALDAPP